MANIFIFYHEIIALSSPRFSVRNECSRSQSGGQGKIRKVLYCLEEEKRIVLLIGVEQNAIVIHTYMYLCVCVCLLLHALLRIKIA